MTFPELHTERFLLQQINANDQSFIFEGLGNADVIRYYGVNYNSLEATAAQMNWYNEIWNQQTGCWWKIVGKANGERIGACGMNYYQKQNEKAEIGYWLLPKFWKQGIINEVLPVMLSHLFSVWKLHRLEALVETENVSSKKVLEKTGFTFEGTLRDAEIKNGKNISLDMYSLLRGE